MKEKKIYFLAGIGFLIICFGLFLSALFQVPLTFFLVLGIPMVILGFIIGGKHHWKCDYCGETYSNSTDCKEHEKSHKKEVKNE